MFNNPQTKNRSLLGMATFILLILASLAQTGPASAELEATDVDNEVEVHCVAAVGSAKEPTCFDSPEKADQLVAQLTAEPSKYASPNATQRAGGNNTIGRHYKGQNFGGSSITIVGTTCNGGVWWPTGSWNNNIESSLNYCGGDGTRFYDSSSCSGTSKTIYGNTSSLGSYNNKASCVRYG